MNKLQQLISACKGSVSITVNPHRDEYKSVNKFISDEMDWGNFDASPHVIEEILSTDTIVRLRFYPDTPVGFYLVWHYDIDEALDKALSLLPNA